VGSIKDSAFMIVRIHIVAFGVMTPCSFVGEYQHFRKAYCIIFMKGKIFCSKICEKMTDTQCMIYSNEEGTEWLLASQRLAT
jgi:hypothetical protein